MEKVGNATFHTHKSQRVGKLVRKNKSQSTTILITKENRKEKKDLFEKIMF